MIPLWVAKDEGLFKRYGTDLDLILIEGCTRGAQALISGDVPLMAVTLEISRKENDARATPDS